MFFLTAKTFSYANHFLSLTTLQVVLAKLRKKEKAGGCFFGEESACFRTLDELL